MLCKKRNETIRPILLITAYYFPLTEFLLYTLPILTLLDSPLSTVSCWCRDQSPLSGDTWAINWWGCLLDQWLQILNQGVCYSRHCGCPQHGYQWPDGEVFLGKGVRGS